MSGLNRSILVIGATGQQGRAATRQLLADGWQVRALTRDPSSPAAQIIAQAGAQLFQGDMENRNSLDEAMQGVYGVFSVLPPEWNPNDAATEKEIRMGKNVADAAKAAVVRHFIFSSVSGADKQARFRYLAKWEIEKYIKNLGLPATILRPSGFMESYANPLFGIQNGTLTEATKPDVPVKLIAVEDIGVFVKIFFGHPDEFLGKTIEVAGDALTPPNIAAAIAKATGRPISYVHLPIETVRNNNATLADLYEWLNGEGYEVDFNLLRNWHPEVMNFEDWLEKQGKALFQK
ncbi:NmrA/HSCARG family protein [Paenibacillus protaetiae]|uniref:NmrA/HSCARG family protein n=1 Tax=Paenibacillus protaetiae TaxID=2509456 RepID=A0A4P6ETA4_9BACL|nr:NmrA/HSCARG family protein [Paenibacillus protaetiae]QAY65846.1 NmrA/HSCARG family protein [Paenibacillus protaetiae]